MLDSRLALLMLAGCLVHASGFAAPRVAHEPITIESGRIEGAISDAVLSFKGIPFAAPPVGVLRWRAPQPPTSWQEIRTATGFGHDCMQLPDPSDAAPLGTHPAEDCLVLNVWRPALRKAGEKLPVLVWIHGGGYVNGGSSAPVYDGSAFARQGIVFVSANYRLGRFGFFAHPALDAAQEGPVGNFAYMDQIAALQWIEHNITAFGGDPHSVTVMGESAGGDSVMHLMTSPPAKGLFHRAIVMSGGGRAHVLGGFKLSTDSGSAPSAEDIGVSFARSVGISSAGPDALHALRALPAERVRGDLNMSTLSKLSDPLTYAKGPIVDGRLVIDAPGDLLKRGSANAVPLLIGTTTQDIAAMLPSSRQDPLAHFGTDSQQARQAYDPRATLPPFEIYLMIGADMSMHEPARFVAKRLTALGQPVWLYRFGYVAGSLRGKLAGAPHASEIPFFFDTVAARYGKAESEPDRAAAHAANAYVVNFVKHGDPNGHELASWPKFDPARSELMMFTPDHGPRYQGDPWQQRLDLVERVAESASPSRSGD
jgi:para-nitrobenzyl esterase